MTRVSGVFVPGKFRQAAFSQFLGGNAAARDRWYDHHSLAICDRRRFTIEMTDVFIAHVDIYKVSQVSLVIIEMFPKRGILGCEFIESLSGARGFDLDLRFSGRKLSERRWDNDCDWHK